MDAIHVVDTNKYDIDIFINDNVVKICGRHRSTLQNYKAIWTSLLTKRKQSRAPQDNFFNRVVLKPEPCVCRRSKNRKPDWV